MPRLARLGHTSFPAAVAVARGQAVMGSTPPPLPRTTLNQSRGNYRPLPEKGGTVTGQAEATVVSIRMGMK